ncbi:hypothetical protein THERMOS_1113 [Bathymodiolus thermophilus thioautotrophic gill symbiont]|uniref:Uncharacterized protein n=1 Tax=Bathymodiolus thermophilus thioautotrophic gill symbiont TaxID=2360 RepID=A0A8H8XE13_9GAMM|nr:hypothetical protein THERMOS_1113 [Bathymodiolus thermophilus thioautotrophic gill symbiont]
MNHQNPYLCRSLNLAIKYRTFEVFNKNLVINKPIFNKQKK